MKRSLAWQVLVWVCALAPLVACAPEEPEVDAYPHISVSACKADNHADRCVLEFGEVPLDETSQQRIEVRNLSEQHPLTFDVAWAPGRIDGFELEAEFTDVEVAPLSIFMFNVLLTPAQLGTYTGKVIIYSDAGLPRPGPVEIATIGYCNE